MNNNNKKSSPLEEIRRVTREATGANRKPPVHPPVTQPSNPGVSPSPRPVNNPAPKPAINSAPTQKNVDFDIDVPNFGRRSGSENVSRAEKVRQARQQAVKAREDSHNTRVIDPKEMTPEQRAELERQREEAHRLVQGNQSEKIRFATRETKIPKSRVSSDPTPPTYSGRGERSRSGISEEFEETVGRGVLSNTVKAVIYIVSVLVISGCLALFAILVGNDCFAFVKSDAEVTVTIPEDADLGDIAKELKKNDIIKYPNMFKLYVMIRNKDTDNYVAGNHTVNGMMGYDTLIAQFKPAAGREEITLTIVEGSTTQEIIDLFVENGIGTQEGFKDTIENYEFDFWFLEELDNIDTSERIYRLDGYLFPDTYNFFTNSSEADALYKLLSNFDAKFDIENKARCEELGMTVDEIIIMASLIQKEAMYVTDYPLVSSVFHNRIDDGMKLESNATVQYTMPKEEVELKLTYDQITTYDNGYNTYLYAGLPEGPICNASLNAINWAMYPTDTDYLYFVSDEEGYNHYAVTYSEHNKNVETYQGD